MKVKRKGVSMYPNATPHPNVPRLLSSFIFFFLLKLTSLSPSQSPPSPANISQTNYTQPFERFAAACWRRLSMIRQHGHSILLDPNLGTLTRKPKPRADKQALGHIQPQTEEARQGGGHREPAVPRRHPGLQPQRQTLQAPLPQSRGWGVEGGGGGCGGKIQRRQSSKQDPQATQALLPPCRKA